MLGAPSGPATIPPATVRSAAGMPKRSAAAARSSLRAAAAAARSGGAASGIERLPKVPRSKGETSVLPITTWTEAAGTASSSATSSPSAVRVPWPASTLPVNAVTEKSAPTCTQALCSEPRAEPANRPGPGAVPALHRTGLQPGLLHRMQEAVLGQALDRRDPLAGRLGRRRDARGHRAPSDQHGAGSAGALAAAELRAREAQVIPEHFEQAAAIVGRDRVLDAVDDDPDLHRAASPARRSAPALHDDIRRYKTGCPLGR